MEVYSLPLVSHLWDDLIGSFSHLVFGTFAFGFSSFGHHLGLMEVYFSPFGFSFWDDIVGSF